MTFPRDAAPRRLLATMSALLLVIAVASAQEENPAELRFSVSFTKAYARNAVSGDLYLLLSEDLVGEPRHKLFDLPMRGYVFRRPFKSLRSGEPVIIDGNTPGFPEKLSSVAAGRYNIQAILDIHPNEHEFTLSPGNGRSRSLRVDLDPLSGGTVKIKIGTEIQRNKAVDIARVRYPRVESRIVGREIGRRFFVPVAVVLPENYVSRKDRKYPIQYWFPAHGESSRGALSYFQDRGIYNLPIGSRAELEDSILVLVGSHCRKGHHLWVDSENNGTFTRAFFEEIVPAVEKEYRVRDEPGSRIVCGRGAGGWSALWLLTRRPGFFGGCWALAPDPVDFHDFFGLDIYASTPVNAFVDHRNRVRPLARSEGRVLISMRAQAEYETVVGTGNLFQSYDAAFGPRGGDGVPRPLFDRVTGKLDPLVAAAWRQFDITRFINGMNDAEAKQLHDKIHLLVGDQDNYYLARPALRLKEALEDQGCGAFIEVLPEINHETINSKAVHLRVQREIADYLRSPREDS